MKKITTPLIYLGLVAGLWLVVRGQRPTAPAAETEAASAQAIAPPEKHRVTAEMAATAGRSDGASAISFQAKDADERTRSLFDLAASRPLVMVFIKDGCPCSESVQTFLNRLHAQYGEACNFVGVIDGDAARARRWGTANHVSYPILQDPALDIVHGYKVESSAYVVLIAPGGRIVKMWPGYSGEMLRELGQRIARLTGRPEQLLAASEAPNELYTGCPY
jgi:peroxiredoxin